LDGIENYAVLPGEKSGGIKSDLPLNPPGKSEPLKK